ncbi:hypothetical protein CLU79DRAFT_518194 [Phycomyces nitens]|nr:hypothetical protein CLU79DRAFT_518194 [Phycomyces nitens]
MQRLWSRVNVKSAQSKCIFCRTVKDNAFRQPLRTRQSVLMDGMGINRPPNSHSQTRTYLSALAHSPSSDNIITESQSPTLVSYLRDEIEQVRNDLPNLSINARSKPVVFAEFYKALATQDIDCIWPVYTHLYSSNYLQHVSRRQYRQMFLSTIRARATQKNLFRLLALIDDMKLCGMNLRLSEYNSLMDWAGGRSVPSKRPHHLTEALALFEEMQSSSKEPGGHCGIKPSLVTFNTLIHIASQLSDIRTAQRLYHDMIARKIDPDGYTYSTLMYSMGKLGDLNGIERMMTNLRESNLEHLIKNTITWNSLMSSYACNGATEKAISMFHEMFDVLRDPWKSNKEAPPADVQSFRIYIELLLWKGDIDDALTYLDQMPVYNIKPIAAVYNAFFAHFMQPATEDQYPDPDPDLSSHDHHQDTLPEHVEQSTPLSSSSSLPPNAQSLAIIQRLYATMRQQKVPPNSDTMYTLVSALLDLGKTTLALETFVQLTDEAAVSPPVQDLRSISIAALAKQRTRLTRIYYPIIQCKRN